MKRYDKLKDFISWQSNTNKFLINRNHWEEIQTISDIEI